MFNPLSKLQKKEHARLAARGPTPAEVALFKRQAERKQRKQEEDAAYKALAADYRKPAEGVAS